MRSPQTVEAMLDQCAPDRASTNLQPFRHIAGECADLCEWNKLFATEFQGVMVGASLGTEPIAALLVGALEGLVTSVAGVCHEVHAALLNASFQSFDCGVLMTRRTRSCNRSISFVAASRPATSRSAKMTTL